MTYSMVKSHAAEQWVKRNPLAKWLAAHPAWSVVKLAERLGVKRQVVYPWMKGTILPDPPRLWMLEKITKITFQEWMRWYDKMPLGYLDKTAAKTRAKKTYVAARNGNGAAEE